MTATPDYYRILHVQPGAPAAVIHASFRTLLQRLQGTTLAGGQDAALLEEAYAVLGDERRRAAYDRQRNPDAAHSRVDQTDVMAAIACLFCATPHGLQRAIERDDDCTHCASPLFPAKRHRLEYSGQRMLNRIPKDRRIDLYVTWPQPAPFSAQMRDVSLNGMQFVAAMPLHANQIVKIDCEELRALARVAHTAPDIDQVTGWSTGVEFLTLHFRNTLGSFVSARV